LFLTTLPNGLGAQTIYGGASLVTPLSALGASARVDALGGAWVGLADDPSALFYNAAGLSQLKAASLSLNHNSYLAGSFEETLLFGLPVGAWGGFAAALQYVSWGGLDARDVNGVSEGSFADGDAAFSLGWGLGVADQLSVGAALHGIQQKIIDSLDTGFSADFGILWAPDPRFQMGLCYTGLGTSWAGFGPAQDLRFGTAFKLDLGKDAVLRMLAGGDWEPNSVSRLQGGLEAVFDRDYFLRVGGQAPLGDNQVGGLTGFTAGAGARLGRFQLDYAFVPYGDLGASHRVSLEYEFPNPQPPVSRPVTVLASPVTIQVPPVTVAAPVPVPVPAGENAKTKLEVLFDLPGVPARRAGHSQSQVAAYEKAASDHPGDSRAWRNLGIVYLNSGQKDLGIQCLEQALRLNPTDQALGRWLSDYHARHPAAR
jgi:hypothetical protein